MKESIKSEQEEGVGALWDDFAGKVMPEYGIQRSMGVQQIDKGQVFGLKVQR